MPPSSPTVSLIVATYNWPRALALVLESVRAQRTMPLEVVVADDGSRDDTRDLLDRVRTQLPVPLVHVWHEDTGFRLAAIRNKAIAQARGTYVVQIDGDILLHPRFVEAHVAFARAGSWVQGSRALCNASLTQRLLDGGTPPPGPLSRGVERRLNAVHAPWLSPFVRGARGAERRVRGCHMAFWREDLLRVNGYDEGMEGWGREDSELAARLCNAGIERRNLKFSAVCYHLWHRSASTASVSANHDRFLRTVREGRTWCERGLDQHFLPTNRVA